MRRKRPHKPYVPKHIMKKRPIHPLRNVPGEDLTAEKLLENTGNWPDRLLIEVGQKLHEGRKIMPLSEDEAPGVSYDKRTGITYAPLDIESCGFHIKALPRRIGTDEVASHAKSSCRHCFGVGKWKVRRTMEIGRNNGAKLMNPVEYELTCRCAEKKYKQLHKQFLVDSQLGEWISLDALEITKAETPKVQDGPKPTDSIVEPGTGRQEDPAAQPGSEPPVEGPDFR